MLFMLCCITICREGDNRKHSGIRMQGGRPPLFRCVPLDEVGNASQALTDCTVHSNELKALFQKVM